MGTEGGNGGFDGRDKQPDFKAGLKQTPTPEVLRDAFVKIDFFVTDSDKVDEVGRQISAVLTDVLGSPYSSFDEISKVASRKENTSEVKRAKEFKELVVEGVDLALRQKRESGVISDDELYLGSAHLTNSLHEVMKGVGPDVSSRYVGDKKLDEILNRLESSRVRRGDDSNDPGSTELLLQRIDIAIPKVLGSDTDEADCTVIALNRERRRLHEELGYEPNTRVGSVTTTEQSKSRTSKKTDGDGEKKPRAPSPTVRLESTMGDVNQTIVDASTRIVTAVNTGAEGAKDLGEKVDRLTGVVEEGVKVGEDTVESMRDLSDGVYGLKDVVGEAAAIIDETGGKVDRVAGAIENNTMALDKNTAGMEDGVDLEKDIINIMTGSRMILSESLIEDLGLDERDSVEADLANRLRSETLNDELLEALRSIKAAKLIRERARNNRERFGFPSDGIEGLYKRMEFIESGTSRADDLTRNSDLFGVLYRVQNGFFDNDLREQEYQGRRLTEDQIKELKSEISMRMFLHDFQLAASKSHSIEDMMRTIVTMHEGDIDGSLDREFIKFFLKGESGLQKLPIAKAWDLRQEGYFEIEKLSFEIRSNEEGFLNYLNKNNNNLHGKVKDKISQLTELGDPQIKGDPSYGVRDVFKNYFCFQGDRGGDNGNRAEMYREYMLWQISQKITGVTDPNRVRKMAEKTYELAEKLSVATFADSKANIGFATDDYTEVILYKLFRYTEGPDRKPDKRGKSKPFGSAYAMQYMETLVCHWLDVSRKPDGEMRWVYSPLYANQVDFNKIGKASNMAYHFGSIVASQALPIKEATTGEKISPKDILGYNGLIKLFAKLNKASTELLKAGIRPVYGNKEGDSLYTDYFNGRKNQVEDQVNEKYRKVWLLNLLFIAGIDSSGWTSIDLDNLEKMLYANEQLIGKDGKPGANFISFGDVKDVFRRTRVFVTVGDNDLEVKKRKRLFN